MLLFKKKKCYILKNVTYSKLTFSKNITLSKILFFQKMFCFQKGIQQVIICGTEHKMNVFILELIYDFFHSCRVFNIFFIKYPNHISYYY